MVRVNTTQINEVAQATKLSESVQVDACGVVNCQANAEVTVKVPSMKGKVETVTLCKKCHSDYQLQFWM